MIADYFMRSTQWELVAFSVERQYLQSSFLGFPVLPYENLAMELKQLETSFFVGIGENDLNHLRTRFYRDMISDGWSPASYVCPSASVSNMARIGRHCFLTENVVIQARATIGDNVMILPNTYIAHHATIEDNVFCSAGVNVSGFARIGSFSFIGSNAAISTCTYIGSGCLVGINCSCTRDLPDNSAMITQHAQLKDNAKGIFNNWHARVAKKARAKL